MGVHSADMTVSDFHFHEIGHMEVLTLSTVACDLVENKLNADVIR